MPPTQAQEEQARTKFMNELRIQKVEVFAMTRIFDIVPFVFNSSRDWIHWKIRLSSKLGVDPCSIFVIGSGCTGVSLNPEKGYKLFDEHSDIDVAIVSGFHFELGWRALRDLKSGRYGLTPSASASLKEHRDSSLYWGMIATDKILELMPFGRDWLKTSIEIAKEVPFEGRDIKFRIYRDSYSLVSYHLNNLRGLQQKLLTGA